MAALTPSPALLSKLGSIIVHAGEYLSDTGHPFDSDAFSALLDDPEVKAWMNEMEGMALLPKTRY